MIPAGGCATFVENIKANMNIKKWFALFGSLLFSVGIYSQMTIEGKTLDSAKNTIEGVVVYVEHTFYEGSSDAKGNYILQVDDSLSGRKLTIVAHKRGYIDLVETLQLPKNQKSIDFDLIFTEKEQTLSAVTITKRRLDKIETGTPRIMTSMDVVLESTNASIISAFNNQPGIQTVGGSGELSVWGGETRETKYYFDGMLVSNAYGTSSPDQSKHFRFASSLFKTIQLNAGGFSAEYGDALSSILEMDTYGLNDKKGMNLFISPLFINTEYYTPISKNQSLEANLNYFDLQYYRQIFRPSEDNFTINSGPRSFEGDLFYKIKFGDRGLLKIFDYASSSAVNSSTGSIENLSAINRSDVKNGYNYLNGTLNYDIHPQLKFFAGISYTYNHDQILIDSILKPIVYSGLLLSVESNYFQAKTKLSSQISSSLLLNGGLEFFSNTDDYGQKPYYIKERRNLTAVFGESTYEFVHDFYLTTGLRGEYNDKNREYHLAPRINLFYVDKDNRNKLRLSYGIFYQNNDPQYLRYNPLEKDAQAVHYVLGYERNTGKQYFKAELYDKEYKRLIKINGNAYDNSGYGYARGLDIYWKDGKSIKNLVYRIGYSYSDTKRNYLYDPFEVEAQYNAKHRFTASLNEYFMGGKFITGLFYSFSSGRPYANPERPLSQYYSDYTKAIHNIDLTLMYQTSFGKLPAILYGSCQNLLGAKQIYNYVYSNTIPSLRRAIEPAYGSYYFVGCILMIGFNKSNKIIDDLLNK